MKGARCRKLGREAARATLEEGETILARSLEIESLDGERERERERKRSLTLRSRSPITIRKADCSRA